MGLDATRPLSYAGHIFTKVKIPGEDEVDLDQELAAAPGIDWEKRLVE